MGCELTDGGAAAIAQGITRNPYLTVNSGITKKSQCLNLSVNKITDVGAITLARALRENEKLTMIDLCTTIYLYFSQTKMQLEMREQWVSLLYCQTINRSLKSVCISFIHNSRIGRELHWKQRCSESRGSREQKRENPIPQCLYDIYQFFNIITDIKQGTYTSQLLQNKSQTRPDVKLQKCMFTCLISVLALKTSLPGAQYSRGMQTDLNSINGCQKQTSPKRHHTHCSGVEAGTGTKPVPSTLSATEKAPPLL